MDPITLIAFILILSILIFVHELGHFIVAKRAGITVEEFAIGFPPRAVKLWQDEGKITLDGHEFVIGRKIKVPRSIQPRAKVFVETGIDEKGRPVILKLELAEQPDKKNLATAGSEARFIDAINRDKSLSSTPSDGERPSAIVDTLVRPTEYSINWIPLGGYVRMVGEEDPTDPGSFASKSKRVRFAVLVAGSLMNLVAAVFFFMLTAMAGVPEPATGLNAQGEERPIATTIVDTVVPGAPAAEAGLQVGDVLLGADTVEFTYVDDLVDYIDQVKGQETVLQVQRGEDRLDLPLIPRPNPPEGQGSMGIGIRYDFENEIVYYPVSESIVRGVNQTAQYVGLTFYMPIAIIQNIFPAEAARPTGPIGIYQQTGSAVEAAVSQNWWFPVLWLTAVLSTALAVTNLLPLPALDGGRILFILIEAIRGKRVAPEKEGAIHFIGLALLLTLMLVISYYDVSNPIPTINWDNLF